MERYPTSTLIQMTKRQANKKIVSGIRMERMAAEGKCIGHLPDERVIFVPFTAPGDLVDVQLHRRRKRYAEGVVDRLVEPSPHRVEPRCAHFGTCGGCKWQHVPYRMQLDAKEQQVYDQLERIGGLEIAEKRPILGADKVYEYRNKLEFTFSQFRWITREELRSGEEIIDKRGLGFHLPGKFDKVLDLSECYLMGDLNNRLRDFVKEYCMTHEGFDFYDLQAHHGLMRMIMLRISSCGEVMVVLMFGEENPDKQDEILTAVRANFPEITSLMYVVNTKLNDSIADLEVRHFSGREYIWEEMEDLRFRVGPQSFYQTNSEQAYKLYKTVRTLADLQPTDLVYDLYTGTGTIASFLSKSARHVIGIEYIEEAVRDARKNADLNGLTNMEFFAGDMKDVLTDDFMAKHGRPDVIVTDPPRAGMHPSVIEVILRAAPKRIVYVSCNPASQARDLQALKEDYDVSVGQPVDMFPQTHHVENVVLLERKENK